MKRVYGLVAIILVVVSIVNGEVVDVRRGRDDNKCGENVMWSFQIGTGVLTISGTGEMYDYSDDDSSLPPWNDIKSSIQSVVIEGGVTSIGDHAFFGSHNLSDVSIPNGLTHIGEGSFESCKNLSVIVFPNSLSFIGNNAFSSCTGLKSVTIPGGVDSIGIQAFFLCSSLESVTISNGVTAIEDAAFYFCENLKALSIPNSVTSIGKYAFSSCSSLTSLVIPESVSFLGDHAFSSCSRLQNLNIPEGVKTIGNFTFSDCELLMIVIIPESVNFFGKGIFSHCKRLSTVFYINSRELTVNAFPDNKPNIVCVPPDYNSTQFCGADIKPSSECRSFQSLFNHCFKAKYNDGVFLQEKRQNATEWEKRTNRCKQFQCNINKGNVSWSLCNSSNDVIRRCSNEICTEENVSDKDWTVVIRLSEGIDEKDISLSELQKTLGNLCGKKAKDVPIRYDFDETGLVVSFVVYVDDEQTASDLVQKLSEAIKEKGCNFGVLCGAKDVRVAENEHDVSGVTSTDALSLEIMLLFFTLIIIAF